MPSLHVHAGIPFSGGPAGARVRRRLFAWCAGCVTTAIEISPLRGLPKFASIEKGGKKFTETLSISNSGNIAAAGTVPIVVYTSQSDFA